MLEPDGSPNTAHSTNLVPFVATVPALRACARADGCATWRRRSLALLGVEQPAEMTGAGPARAGP